VLAPRLIHPWHGWMSSVLKERTVEPNASATTYPLDGRWPLARRAARAPAGLERGGDRSAGPAGGRAARGERSEPP
jgi:hypothetical protein